MTTNAARIPKPVSWLRWLAAALLLGPLLLLAPHLASGTDVVRLRNAVLLDGELNESFRWQAPPHPADFRVDRPPFDPYFVSLVDRLQVAALATDSERAVALAAHLLASHTPLLGGAVRDDLAFTHQAITQRGEGYCNDFVRVYQAMASAAGLPLRAWAFSFDGFGGHGHIFLEFWNRQSGRWELMDLFNNFQFRVEGQASPLSAEEFRHHMLERPEAVQMHPLVTHARPGWEQRAKAEDYYRRGLDEWYLFWGSNALQAENGPLARGLGVLSYSLGQIGAVAEGNFPSIRLLRTSRNAGRLADLRILRYQLLGSLLCWVLVVPVWLAAARRGVRSVPPLAADPLGSQNQQMPGLIVYSSLFPNSVQPHAGLFIRERMFRLRPCASLVVVSPQPWFPFQGVIRLWHPGYRPAPPKVEVQDGIAVYFPRFLSLPGVLRRLDAWSMAVCTWPLVRRLVRQQGFGLLDSHFAYPCGSAAVRLGRWLKVPATITLRGTETRHLATPALAAQVIQAVQQSAITFSVSESLRRLVVAAGVNPDKVRVVGNGVDMSRFFAEDRSAARARLDLPPDAPVLVSVGGLVDRKGFHRVIDLLPSLQQRHPGLRYLVVGGPSPEGDMGPRLRQQVVRLGLENRVHFTGALPPDELRHVLSAADLFVLATANEGWANVFLEAMACGLPVVTTDVGGNAEVVSSAELGAIVPFGDPVALESAIDRALMTPWNRQAIVAYAQVNSWDSRVAQLREAFGQVLRATAVPATAERHMEGA